MLDTKEAVARDKEPEETSNQAADEVLVPFGMGDKDEIWGTGDAEADG